jgi:hypothetical protein
MGGAVSSSACLVPHVTTITCVQENAAKGNFTFPWPASNLVNGIAYDLGSAGTMLRTRTPIPLLRVPRCLPPDDSYANTACLNLPATSFPVTPPNALHLGYAPPPPPPLTPMQLPRAMVTSGARQLSLWQLLWGPWASLPQAWL